MTCPACNYELSVHSDACEHCGAPSYLALAIQVAEITHCTYCGARDETGSAACPTCGLKKNFKTSDSLVGTCRNCGATWRTAWMYCQTCGIARENGLVDVTLPTSFVPSVSAGALPSRSFHAAAAVGHSAVSDLYDPPATANGLFFPPSESGAEASSDPHMLLSETEVVARMFPSDETVTTPGRKLELADFFSESDIVESLRPAAGNGRQSEPATTTQVVYDLPAPSPVRQEAAAAPAPRVTASLARAAQTREAPVPAPPQPDPVVPLPALTHEAAPAEETSRVPVEPLPNPPQPEAAPPPPSTPTAHKTEPLMAPPKQAATQPNNGPVQTVRVLHRTPSSAPPLDKKLIKIIAALIFFILVFSALIVSGFRLRDLFGKPPASPIVEASPAASVVTPAPSTLGEAPAGMVAIPGGVFRMGRTDGDTYETPTHEVTVASFFMDRTEVTNAQYAEFLQATNHAAPPDWKSGKYEAGTDPLPVVNVSWQDANDYAAWAGKRLPTEAEWEYAARARDTRLYPWGANWDAAKANTAESNLNRLTAADSYADAANPFGLLNMAGNVWEWVNGEVVSYKDANITLAPGKVIRGGAYYLPKERATTTYRGFAPADKISEKIGFRCVRDVNDGQRQ